MATDPSSQPLESESHEEKETEYCAYMLSVDAELLVWVRELGGREGLCVLGASCDGS